MAKGILHLLAAIEKVEKKYGINFYEKMVETSLKNPQVMIAIMKKLVPDQTEQSLKGNVSIKIITPDGE